MKALKNMLLVFIAVMLFLGAAWTTLWVVEDSQDGISSVKDK